MAEKKTSKKHYIVDKKSACTARIQVFKQKDSGEFEPAFMTDQFNNVVYDKRGQKVPVMKDIVFHPVVTNPKLGSYCEHITEDYSEILGLDKLVKDGTTPVIESAQWKRERNPQAAEIEDRLNKEKEARAAAEDKASKLAAESADKDKKLEELKKRVEDLKRGR